MESRVIFRGRQGYLPLDQTGAEKEVAGHTLPEFLNKSGEPMEIPTALVAVVKAAVRGANCIECTHQHYVAAPRLMRLAIFGLAPHGLQNLCLQLRCDHGGLLAGVPFFH
jgi:hypothetical protein